MAGEKRQQYLMIYLSLYILAALTTYALPYKMIQIGPITTFGSVFILPFWYILGDSIAELFGYGEARQAIWLAIICCLLYTLIVTAIIHIPGPRTWHHQAAYNYIFGPLYRVALGGNFGVLVGTFINAYLISRWKIALNGKYFAMRSMLSTAIGEALQLSIVITTMYFGRLSMAHLFELIAATITLHFILTGIMVIPNTFVVSALKRKLPDTFDIKINYNPFKFFHQ